MNSVSTGRRIVDVDLLSLVSNVANWLQRGVAWWRGAKAYHKMKVILWGALATYGLGQSVALATVVQFWLVPMRNLPLEVAAMMLPFLVIIVVGDYTLYALERITKKRYLGEIAEEDRDKVARVLSAVHRDNPLDYFRSAARFFSRSKSF